MATTTTNFGWDIPQSTDLVKDGATAIAALGQDIDTSMADLKGGTTGQILSKASGTDMDFTWINNDQGDITGVTAGTGLTGGGTSGSVTLDFDVANYGGGQYAAGKNKIINGDFGIWQRGTSSSSPASGTYTAADRWLSAFDGTAGTYTVSQQTFTPGTAPVAGYEGTYFCRYAVTVAGTGNSVRGFDQRMEDVRTFAGQTATVSVWLKADTARTVTVQLYQNFGSGGSSEVYLTAQNLSVTTSWTRFTATFSVPSISGKTIGVSNYLALRFGTPIGVTSTIDFWGVQVEAGSTATPFQTATGTKQGELAACQRYYWDSREAGTTNQPYAGYTNSTDYLLSNVRYPVTMRTTPSITIGQSSGSNYVRRISTNGQLAITVTSYPGTAPTGFSAVYCAAAPFTAGTGYDFYILASAEL